MVKRIVVPAAAQAKGKLAEPEPSSAARWLSLLDAIPCSVTVPVGVGEPPTVTPMVWAEPAAHEAGAVTLITGMGLPLATVVGTSVVVVVVSTTVVVVLAGTVEVVVVPAPVVPVAPLGPAATTVVVGATVVDTGCVVVVLAAVVVVG